MLDNFIIIVLAILIEAFPFVVFGALISGIVEEFVPSSLVTRLMPQKVLPSVIAGSFMGALVPMCECGSVLIVRRLIMKGVPSATAITYMLAGPIVNPITLASTYTAYSWHPQMVLWRSGLGIMIAAITGIIIYKTRGNNIVQKGKGFGIQIVKPKVSSFSERIKHALTHAMNDFIMIFSLLLLGATVTALFKAFAPSEIFIFFKRETWIGVPVFAALAFIFSLCSEADAFIASALNGVFDLPSQLAFLTLGPMFDLKLIMMYKRVFQKETFISLCVIPSLLIVLSCIILQGLLWHS